MFEGLLMYIVGGAVIGILARFFKPGADPVGWIMTILLGALGAAAGGYIAGMLNVTNRALIWVDRDPRGHRVVVPLGSGARQEAADCLTTEQPPAPACRGGLGWGCVVTRRAVDAPRARPAPPAIPPSCPGAIPALPALRTANRCR